MIFHLLSAIGDPGFTGAEDSGKLVCPFENGDPRPIDGLFCIYPDPGNRRQFLLLFFYPEIY